MMTEERNVSALLQALAYFSSPADHERYFDLYDPFVVLHGYAGVEPGLDNVKQFYAAFRSAFPDSRISVEEMIAKDDRVVCRFTLTATHQGDFMGVPATGRAITLPGMTILKFVDGRCTERWSQADFLGLLQQLGALPGPAAG